MTLLITSELGTALNFFTYGRPGRVRVRNGQARSGRGRVWRGKVPIKTKVKSTNRIVGAISNPSNGAEDIIKLEVPYIAQVTIMGTADLLFHRWDCDAVQEKADAKKGSAAKKTDNVESYVYRLDSGELAVPGEYLRMSLIGAAKFKQDPRSPRKSAADLFKAAVISLTPLAGLGTKKWDYEDRRRCVIQRNSITRVRPAMKAGWSAQFELQINLPEYVDPHLLNEVIQSAGKLIGVGDFRPTFGRFQVVNFKVLEL